jgi:hypothetical protein
MVYDFIAEQGENAMNQEFRNFVQGQLTSCIAPFTRPDGPGLSGNTVPFTLAEFHNTLMDRLDVSALNGWDLDKVEAEDLIALADKIYRSYYAGWVSTPLYGDAPANVVAWQKAAKAAV